MRMDNKKWWYPNTAYIKNLLLDKLSDEEKTRHDTKKARIFDSLKVYNLYPLLILTIPQNPLELYWYVEMGVYDDERDL